MSGFRLQSACVFALMLTALVAMGCNRQEELAGVGGMTDAERMAVAKGAGADAAMMSEVERKLGADEETSKLDIDVSANLGVVTLSGKVTDQAQKERAEQLAKGVEGVRRVENNLVIASIGPQDLDLARR